jgi:hypothetical protein
VVAAGQGLNNLGNICHFILCLLKESLCSQALVDQLQISSKKKGIQTCVSFRSSFVVMHENGSTLFISDITFRDIHLVVVRVSLAHWVSPDESVHFEVYIIRVRISASFFILLFLSAFSTTPSPGFGTSLFVAERQIGSLTVLSLPTTTSFRSSLSTSRSC